MTGLVKNIDKHLQGNKKSRGAMILLAENDTGNAKRLEKLAEKEKIKMPLTINGSGKKPPAKYKLNPKAKYTVIVYEKKKTIKSFALKKIGDDDIKEIVKTLSAKAG